MRVCVRVRASVVAYPTRPRQVVPSSGWYRPSSQLTHDVALSLAYVPAGHRRQDVLLTCELACPSGHVLQVEARLASWYCPRAHEEQESSGAY